MKYFTKELWAGMQDESTENECRKIWDSNLEAYQKQFELLKSRLSKKAIDFFSKVSLHDGTFISFNIINEKGRRRLNNLPGRSTRNPTTVELEIIGCSDSVRKLYILRYINVRKIRFDFPTEKPLFFESGQDVGDIGYHELTSADEEFLGHEFLFDTGTSLFIEFKRFSFSSKSYLIT